MDLKDFKNKLDNREFWGNNSKEMWDAAYKWQDESNNDDSSIKWSWDCGLKLDYDGSICIISSRFYPPHKVSAEYGKYSGTISVYVADKCVHEQEIEAITLDDLKASVERNVSEIIAKINSAIISVF